MKPEVECQAELTCSLDGSVRRRGTSARAAARVDAGTAAPRSGEAAGRRMRFAKRVHLFREGDPAAHMFELVDGAVMLYKLLPDGRRQIVEMLLGPGDVFGITSLQAQFCALHEHAVLLGRKTALERVASFVMHCVPGRGGADCGGPSGDDDSRHIRFGMTREEIADYLGLTLETVSRAVSKLRRRGMVTINAHGKLCGNDVCRICHLTGAH